MRAHFPSITKLKPAEYTEYKVDTDAIHAYDPGWLSVDKLKHVFQIFKSKKSPGPDGLKPLVLKNLTQDKLNEIIFMYKATIILQFTPTQWKESNIIWIPKSHKNDYKHYKSWRPISLSNYLIKALEKLITWEVDLSLIHI